MYNNKTTRSLGKNSGRVHSIDMPECPQAESCTGTPAPSPTAETFQYGTNRLSNTKCSESHARNGENIVANGSLGPDQTQTQRPAGTLSHFTRLTDEGACSPVIHPILCLHEQVQRMQA
ncbi:hypothetical protein ACCO45_012649 [Purpureocillium lilacinum]|uniref:Uncharacterized protein n=1 Tax=Purpureocillium lilacinum TaxID=33203 RepID=A0ACC4DB51_PURLI